MSAEFFSVIFIVVLSLSVALRLWLARRHLAHIAQHRAQVPSAFGDKISLEAHQKAADYTSAKVRIGLIELALGTLWLLVLTLGGGLNFLTIFWSRYFAHDSIVHGVALIASLTVLSFIVDLPFSLYRTFKLEARFGFNRMTARLYISDILKQTLLGCALGLPILWAVLSLMQRAGANWWMWVWALWLGLNLTLMIVYPLFIAPLFNKFTPLSDEGLKARVEALLKRCGFRAKGLFVMDGSRRSGHGNAYFTGFGAGKRIVFFDTLLKNLNGDEIEAVLAHELGHFKHHHLWQRLSITALGALGFLALLGFLMQQTWFYEGLGVAAANASPALALVLFSLIIPLFSFIATPLMNAWSRKHEFQADAYAAKQARAEDLISALVKLYQDNASTLTPDRMYSLFYDSHPPAALRIGALQKSAVAT